VKDLLLAIKAELQSTVTAVLARDVYITEDIHLIRNAGGYPALALKDGGTDFALESSINETDTLTVTIAVYVKLLKDEAGIIGDSAANQPGVLDLAGEVIAALRDNTLGGVVDLALPVSVGESVTLAIDNLAVQMAPVTMRFERYV